MRDSLPGGALTLWRLILGIPMGLQGFGGLVSKSCWMQMEWRSSMGCERWSRVPGFLGRRR